MRHRFLAASLLYLTCHGTAMAATDGDMDFSLQLSTTDLRLRYDQTAHTTTVERIGVTVFDITTPRLQYGFIAGSSHLTAASDPALAGLSLDGYHAGLALQSQVGQNPRLSLRLHYLYQDVRDDENDRKIILTWHEWGTEVEGKLRLGGSLSVVAGAAYVGVDAQQRITGNGARTLNPDTETGAAGRLGLELDVKSGGRVGLHIQRGTLNSTFLIFARTFN
jgi:hypothetical protein